MITFLIVFENQYRHNVSKIKFRAITIVSYEHN